MANCKECYHYEVCRMHYQQKCELTYETEKEVRRAMLEAKKGSPICDHFKDRSRFVELLCEVGSTVFILDYDDGEPYDYSGYILLMANKNHALLSPIVNGEKDPYELCEGYFENLEDDGSPYCGGCIIVPIHELMTREEAEQALKERET